MIEKLAQFISDIRCCLVVGGLSVKVCQEVMLFSFIYGVICKLSLSTQFHLQAATS